MNTEPPRMKELGKIAELEKAPTPEQQVKSKNVLPEPKTISKGTPNKI